MDKLALYNKLRAVPEEAKKSIGGGRLKGMTDINPMYRIKALTEAFGPCGVGWYYEITNKEIMPGANGEVVAIVDINLFIRSNISVDEWSKPIPGTGGSMFIANEKSGLYTSDEAFKMALTDALSVACKALGVGADVYWSKDRTKYDSKVAEQDPTKAPVKAAIKPEQTVITPHVNSELICTSCGVDIIDKVAKYSTSKFGNPLCMDCQKKSKEPLPY